MKSYFLQVKEIIQETKDAVTIQFWHPISEEIRYKAGQFITISIPDGENKKTKRSYSMSSSPDTDTSVAVTVKRVPNGIVSNYLNEKISKGDFLEVTEPMGNFYFEPTDNPAKTLVLFAAGSGITPLISIAKTALKTQTQTKVKLIYGNRNEDTIIFKESLKALVEAYPDRLEVAHVLSSPSMSWLGQKGRVSFEMAEPWLSEGGVDYAHDHFYMCGPVAMMDDLKAGLERKQVSKAQLHLEKFNSSAVFSELEELSENRPATQTVQIKYDGSTYDVAVAPHQTILEAALEQDIDLPYSCQAGMCTACMGKCTSGKILMDEDDGLTEKEIKQGYVLTCVAHPLSANVVLEID
jgi:ring-1,2-phenylacetyl-CoA epoxidase subunit PaaE